MAVEDQAITDALARSSKSRGFLMCPEGAATYAAWKEAMAKGWIRQDDVCLLFNLRVRNKYPSHLPIKRSTAASG